MRARPSPRPSFFQSGFPFYKERAYFHLVFFLLIACSALLPIDSASAEDPASAAQKKYRKEVTALFESIELVESVLPASVFSEEDTLVPAFKIRNKTNHEIIVPLAIGYPSDNGGVLGFPVWSFEKIEKRGSQPVKRKGVLAKTFKLDSGGVFPVDATNVKGLAVSDLGLSPGKYQMTVVFLPYVGLQGVMLSSKPFKFEIKAGPQVDSAGQPGSVKPVATAASSTKARQGLGPQGKSAVSRAAPTLIPSVSLAKLDFASEAVKSGAPLSVSFELTVSPSRPLPADDPNGPQARLNCSWTIFRLGPAKSPKSRTRVSGSIMNVSSASMDELRKSGVTTLKLLSETAGLAAGDYELSVVLWEEGSQSERTNGDSKTSAFRISR